MNRWKQIKQEIRRALETDLRRLYFEVFGANFSGSVTPERARESIKEACNEMLERGRLKPQPAGQEHTIMAKAKQISDTTTEQLLVETVENGINAILEKLTGIDEGIQVLILKAGGEKRKVSPAPTEPKKEKPATETFVPVTDPKTGEKKLQEVKPEAAKEPPSIETMRELATKYSAAFGMNDLLTAFQRFGGAKKLSDVAKESLITLYAELDGRLKAENGKKATEIIGETKAATTSSVTLEEIKPKAKAFLDKNGAEALGALLKSFGAAKLSALAPEKFPAFLEALDNA